MLPKETSLAQCLAKNGHLMPMLTGRNHHRPMFLRSTDAASLEKVSAGTKTRNTKLLSVCRASPSKNTYSCTDKQASMQQQHSTCCEQHLLKRTCQTHKEQSCITSAHSISELEATTSAFDSTDCKGSGTLQFTMHE